MNMVGVKGLNWPMRHSLEVGFRFGYPKVSKKERNILYPLFREYRRIWFINNSLQ